MLRDVLELRCRNHVVLETASYVGKREALATLNSENVAYGRNDYPVVVPPAVHSATLIGSS